MWVRRRTHLSWSSGPLAPTIAIGVWGLGRVLSQWPLICGEENNLKKHVQTEFYRTVLGL